MNYVLERRTANGTLPENPVAVKTIVSTELCKKIADAYGCDLKNVLTGFKFIGEQVLHLEEKGEENRFVFGFEESYGYLSGSFVRDKDAVIASMLICEMTAYYKTQGQNLLEVLDSLYKKYGYFYSAQKSFTFEGQAGTEYIKSLMAELHSNPPAVIDGIEVTTVKDYETSVSRNLATNETSKIDLPKSNVVAFEFSDGSSFIVRPSGTEPKIKFYINALGSDSASAAAKVDQLVNAGTKLLGV